MPTSKISPLARTPLTPLVYSKDPTRFCGPGARCTLAGAGMDCDDATLLLTRTASSLTDEEALALDEHVAGCETCFELLRERGRGVGPGNFEVGETIAVGGMGRIFRAFDRRLGRDVA